MDQGLAVANGKYQLDIELCKCVGHIACF